VLRLQMCGLLLVFLACYRHFGLLDTVAIVCVICLLMPYEQ